jgi:hypothetical protein
MRPTNPTWRRHDRHRFIRHDAHRFFTPLGNAKRRAAQAAEAARHEQQAEAARQDAFDRELFALRRELKQLLSDSERRRFEEKYRPDQPRVPAGSPEGGQWTGGGGNSASNDGLLEQDRGSQLTTARDQAPRGDLSQLEAIANDPAIRSRIDEAWAASNPNGIPREHGFWISRNEATGELFTRPFANPGSTGSIVPGPPPSDAIASFHTHPLRPDFGGLTGPSRGDLGLAGSMGLPGLLQSHTGMYYFGPALRPVRSR